MTSAYSAWTYREVEIDVVNPPTIEGILGKITITKVTGMNADGSDFRFSDLSGNVLSYWVESLVSNVFTIWVELPANATQIYFYFGNVSATSESTTSIFEFFDDFLTTIDSSKWTVTSGSWSINNSSYLSSNTANSIIKSVQTFGTNYKCEMKLYHESGTKVFYGLRNPSTYHSAAWEGARSGNNNDQMYTRNSASAKYTDDGVNRSGNFYVYGVAYLAGSVKFYVDYTLRGTQTDYVPTEALPICISSTDTTYTIVDWVRVRKYVAVEPTLTLGPYPNWLHRNVPLYVSNPSTTDGVQQYMKIFILYGMNEDGSDFRFTDLEGGVVPYWVESVTSGVAKVWLKLPANDTQLYFFYGNSSATAVSSGDATFEFFDDFATADHNKWTFPAHYDVTNGILHVYSQNNGDICVSTLRSFGTNVIVRASIKSAHTGLVANIYERPVGLGNASNEIIFEAANPVGSARLNNTTASNGYNVTVNGWSSGVYYITELTRFTNESSFLLSGNLYENSTYYPTDNENLRIRAISFTASTKAEVWCDWIAVRKYVAVEPLIFFDPYETWKKTWNEIIVYDPSSTAWVQASVKLCRLAGMQELLQDIRFTDIYGNPVTYHIEKMDENVFTIWLRLPADERYVYFHYGNDSATSESTGAGVFEFYDTFTTLDGSVWYTVSGSPSVSDSVLTLGGTSRESLRSVVDYPVNMIIDMRMCHASGNDGVNGFLSNDNQEAAVWQGASGVDTSDYMVTGHAGSFTVTDENVDRAGTTYHTYTINYKSSGIDFYIDDHFRATSATNVPTGYIGLVLDSMPNKGNVCVSWVRIRKYVDPLPTTWVCYDLSALDPTSIDITSSIDEAYTQLTATFPHNLVPKEKCYIIYRVSGSDISDYIEFFGMIDTIDTTLGFNGDGVQIVAASEMIDFTRQRIAWYASRQGDKAGTLYGWMGVLTYSSFIEIGNYIDSMTDTLSWLQNETTTKYEMLKKICEYFGVIYNTRLDTEYGDIVTILDCVYPETIDDPTNGFYLPSPIELNYPDLTLVDNPSITRYIDGSYNRVTIYGNDSSTGQTVAYVAAKYPNQDNENYSEYNQKDDTIYEKGSTALAESIKWLLYFLSKRVSVKMRFVNRFGLELYQRIRFGEGFRDELIDLTNEPNVPFVYVYDLMTGYAEDTYPYSYTAIDVHGVPMPDWLRIVSKSYHKDSKEEYLDIEAETDWIYSASDPVISAPYSTYVNKGYRKPTIRDSTDIIKTISENAVNALTSPEKGTVNSVSTDGTKMIVTTISGKIIQCYRTNANVNDIVLVTPDGKGNYYGTVLT